jgi:hypothetical protein
MPLQTNCVLAISVLSSVPLPLASNPASTRVPAAAQFAPTASGRALTSAAGIAVALAIGATAEPSPPQAESTRVVNSPADVTRKRLAWMAPSRLRVARRSIFNSRSVDGGKGRSIGVPGRRTSGWSPVERKAMAFKGRKEWVRRPFS